MPEYKLEIIRKVDKEKAWKGLQKATNEDKERERKAKEQGYNF